MCARPLSLRAGKIEFRGIGGFFAFVFFLGSFGGSSDGRGGVERVETRLGLLMEFLSRRFKQD